MARDQGSICNPPERATARGWAQGRRAAGDSVEDHNDSIEDDGEQATAAGRARGRRDTVDPGYVAEPEPDFEELEEFEHNYSIGKDKWILNAQILDGSSTDHYAASLPPMQDPRNRRAFPANVPGQNINIVDIYGRLDTFRYVTGKFWMNLAHANGPREGIESFLSVRRPNGPSGLFAFHNPSRFLFKAGNVELRTPTIEDRTGNAATNWESKILGDDSWVESAAIRRRFSRGHRGDAETLNLPATHEVYKISFPPHHLQTGERATARGWAQGAGAAAQDRLRAAAREASRLRAEAAGLRAQVRQWREHMNPADPKNTAGDLQLPSDAGRHIGDLQQRAAALEAEANRIEAEAQTQAVAARTREEAEAAALDRVIHGAREDQQAARRRNDPTTANWNWRNYMFGLPGGFNQNGIELSNARGASVTSEDSTYRPSGEGSTMTWPGWDAAHYSKNLFPVIPFYGTHFEPQGNDPGFISDWFNPGFRPPAVLEETFFDHVTKTPAFLTKEQTIQTPLGVSSYVDIDAVYNFYDCVYEDLVSPLYEEKRLPNFYKMRPENYEKKALPPWGVNYGERITEMARRESLRVDRAATGQTEDYNELVRRAAAERYGVFTLEDYPTVRSWDIFDNPGSPDFKRIFEERRIFPMYAEIEFSSREPSQFAQALRMGQERSIMKELLVPFATRNDHDSRSAHAAGAPVVRERVMEMVNLFTSLGASEEGGSGDTSTSISDTTEAGIKYMKLESWLRWFEQNSQPDEDRPLTLQDRFRSLFSRLIIRSRLKKLIMDNYRKKFSDILSGTPAYSEVLAYRVEKKIEGEPTQNFYFGTDDDVEIVRYLDSQVEYGVKYTYRVYKIIIVIGTEYAYADCMTDYAVRDFYNKTFQHTHAEMFFGVIHKPSVQVMEIPMQEKEIVILDKPPMPPDVNVIPFKGSASRVLFNLNSGLGELYAPPVILEEDDNAQFDLVATNQAASFDMESWLPPPGEAASPDELIHFKNDDETRIFEVFRLEKEPRSWDDFRDNKHTVVSSGATNASFEDSILPNKKYYYTFRSEDNHGHVSNPTHIYQIEMVKDGESVYMRMDLFKFKEPTRQKKETFRKRIQINPAFLQKILPLPQSGMFSDWETDQKIGNSENPVWGKRFKFRITSKSTGKQIDLNFKFIKKYARIPEEVQNTVHNSDKC